MSKAASRERLHRLVDELPTSELENALSSLELLATPSEEPAFVAMRRALQLDPEELSAEDQAALAEAYEDFDAGRTISHEEVKRRWLGGE